MSRLLVFGPGYTAGRVAADRLAAGWHVTVTRRAAASGWADAVDIADGPAMARAIAGATHILSSIPPEGDADPVLAGFGAALAASGAWLSYLSSTGVYGDAGGAWVDESAAIGHGRRGARAAADAGWLALGARVFRLPGIYGPGRSPFDRLAAGRAYRVDTLGQVFSRVHVDDIVSGVVAALDAPPGAYNLADDAPCAQHEVVAFAARLIGMPPPPFVAIDSLPSVARGFYAENRRVANSKAKRLLGWRPRYPDYRSGLRALSAMTSPASASAAPPAASSDQR